MKNEKVLDIECLDYLDDNNNVSPMEFDELSKDKCYEENNQFLSLGNGELYDDFNDKELYLEKEPEKPLSNQDEIPNNFIPQAEPPQIIYKNKFNIYNENGLFKKGYSSNKIKNETVNKKEKLSTSSNAKLFKTHKKVGKILRQRKEKPDDMRKKIKSRFLKTIKIRINEMLKNANSEMQFDYLPQSFVIDVSRQTNKQIINMKYKDLLLYEFVQNYIDYQKYEHNIEVIDYLDKNPDICKKSNFHIIGEKTFSEMFNEYLMYDDFKLELENLKNIDLESDEYINNYKYLAETFISYYSK
jgi:hypothetical protein